MAARDELNITRCMLLGCTFVHNDYGHPERKHAGNHYQCVNSTHSWWIGWGHNEAEAAYDYLRRYRPDLLVTRQLNDCTRVPLSPMGYGHAKERREMEQGLQALRTKRN